MDKKGIGWGIIVIIIIILISAIIIFGWQFKFGKWAKGMGESSACKISIIQSSSFLGRLQLEDWPNLKGCPVDSIEIKGNDEDEVIKELSEYMFNAAKDFYGNKYFSKEIGRYCRKRYSPLTFKKKDLKILKQKFYSYLDQNRPNEINFWIYAYKEEPYIDTSKSYSMIFVADFGMSLLREAEEALPSVLEKPVESELIAIEFVENSKIEEELECDNPI